MERKVWTFQQYQRLQFRLRLHTTRLVSLRTICFPSRTYTKERMESLVFLLLVKFLGFMIVRSEFFSSHFYRSIWLTIKVRAWLIYQKHHTKWIKIRRKSSNNISRFIKSITMRINLTKWNQKRKIHLEIKLLVDKILLPLCMNKLLQFTRMN